MKKWKKILLGVFGGLVISGLCYLHNEMKPSYGVLIKDGPSGDSEQELTAKALRGVLNTDGSFATLSVTTLSPTTLNVSGVTTLGAGTKGSGWVSLDTLELSQTATNVGTVGSNIALAASSTYFVEAWIIGIGATVTSINASYVATGTFRRTGTAADSPRAGGTRPPGDTCRGNG